MTEKFNSYVYFSLTGDDFNPQEVTDRLGLEPSESWQKGDKGKYNPSLKYSCWKISTEKGREYFDIDKLVGEIVDKLDGKVEAIIELKSKFQLDSVLEIVMDIDTNSEQSTPSLGHDLKTIDFLYQTKTTTDVDIYRFNSLEKSTDKSEAFKNDEKTFQRLDWSILQSGWVSLYWNSEILKNDLKWFASQEYGIIHFDCKSWTNDTEMHKQLKNELNFPDYYGENFDALNDCLSDIEISGNGQIVVFNHLDCLDIKSTHILLDIFADNSRLHLLFGNRLFVLAQLDNPDLKIDSVGATPVTWNNHEWLESNRNKRIHPLRRWTCKKPL